MARQRCQLPVLNLRDTLTSLPKPTISNPKPQIHALLDDSSSKIPVLVILDDDPTGTQTSHDIIVLTKWDTPTLEAELKGTPAGKGFFILTNSRALSPGPAGDLITEILTNLKAASSATGVPFEIVLRSDSTLRGHFPLELDVATKVLGSADACLLCPFFEQGGRYTIGNVHYVAERDELVPAAQTPFARDASFGYLSSDLRDYVEEKTSGRILRDDVEVLSLDLIRTGGPDAVLKKLLEVKGGSVVIVNAVNELDMDIVILAVLRGSQAGKRFFYRTGAGFLSSRLGIEQIPPITANALNLKNDVGGLVIAGSYVPKTTAQLEVLRKTSGEKLTVLEMDVEELLSSAERRKEAVDSAIQTASKEITSGRDVLVMTSRKLVVGADEAKSLEIGSIIADTLVDFLVRLQTKPRYVIAKGGITSSDMAQKGLRMKRAMIVGQASVGVPLWRCDEEGAKWPGLPYVVFPGNVGGEDALAKLVEDWRPE